MTTVNNYDETDHSICPGRQIRSGNNPLIKIKLFIDGGHKSRTPGKLNLSQ